MKKTAGFLILILFFSFCRKQNLGDCFKSNGPDVSETRALNAFDKIMVFAKVNLEVFQGNEYKVEVIAGKNIIKNITTKMVGDTLFIENENTCNFVRGYKREITVNVTLPHLTYLENEGVGVSRVNYQFVQDSISLRVSNSGDVIAAGTYTTIKTTSNSNGDMTVEGYCKKLYVFAGGVNYVHTDKLMVSDFMFIHSATLGDCYVNADGTKRFEYNIGKSGNIYYTGTPGEIKNYSSDEGTGQLIKQ